MARFDTDPDGGKNYWDNGGGGGDGGYTPPDPPPYVTPGQDPNPFDPPPDPSNPAGPFGTNPPAGNPRWPEYPTPDPNVPSAPKWAPFALPGWDQNKWADPNKHDTKYDIGRILSGYAPTTQGLQQAWAEILKQYPGATFNGKDTISGLPGTMGPVDVLAGASHGGDRWWWGDSGGMAADAKARQTGQAPQYPTSSPYPTTPTAPTTPNTAALLGANPYNGTQGQVNAFFRDYLGRDASQQEVNQWGSNINPGYLNGISGAIYNTPEAQAYRARGGTQGAQSTQGAQGAQGATGDTSTTGTHTSELGANTSTGDPFSDQINALYRQYYGRDASAGEIQSHRGNPGGAAAVEAALKASQGSGTTTPPAPTTPGGGVGGGGYNANNPFDDPATKSYIDLLNQRIQSLMQPQQNPEMDSLLAYMQQYFQQLQKPVYSDSQRDLINTQTLDPMERQRQARKQQVIQHMASRGMGPGDGPTIQALQDVDRQFDQMRTGKQADFSINEINMGRENQSRAVDVGSAAAGLRNGMFQQQDQRANSALGYARQIPDMAQQRLQTAIGLLNQGQINPAQLMGVLNQFNQTGNQQHQQDSQYWQSIIAAMMKAFGMG